MHLNNQNPSENCSVNLCTLENFPRNENESKDSPNFKLCDPGFLIGTSPKKNYISGENCERT